MHIEVIISTLNSRVESVLGNLLQPRSDLSYLIVHQVTEELPEAANEVVALLNARFDVKYIEMHCKGLSKSRNKGLVNSSGDIIILFDDDAQLVESSLSSVKNAFHDKKVDFCTMKARCPDGEPFKAAYKGYSFSHTEFSIFSVSSIEIALRKDSIERLGVEFDERFGLGAKYSASEENIFLLDLIKSGASGCYYPRYLSTHPSFSSGRNWGNENMAFSKGAFFRRCFGFYKGLVLLFLFSIKKYPDYKDYYSFTGFFRRNVQSFKSL
ncbi:glycosyltransferase [Idiomarina sp.]|uniref:glycosyltransferase family 2 protein n=1 Tax=Idiomarina sp. TaxID=1874361 RepID=UPI00258A19D5|nr:glycosyltransferase [Idiomarina sp.]